MESKEILEEMEMNYDEFVSYLLKKYGPAKYDYFTNAIQSYEYHTELLAQKVKGGFLTRLTLPDLKNSRIEKSKQVIELKAVFNQLREYAFDTSDFHTHIKALSDGEIKALVSSFGIKVMKKAIAVLMSLFEGTPISLEESDRPSLIQRFEYNPSLCLREIANNF